MKIAFFLQDVHGGGAERVAIAMMNALAERHDVALFLVRRAGDYLADIDSRVRMIGLVGGTTTRAIRDLARTLRRERPDILVSHLTHVNVAAVIGVALSRTRTPLVAVEHNQMGLNFSRLSRRSVRLAYRAVRFVYPRIDAVVPVSDGVAQSIRHFAGLKGDNFEVIANPVVTPMLRARLDEQAAHPWFHDHGPPVILGCGRLVEQKDFGTLIAAFARVAAERPARLLILGEGERRAELEAQVRRAGLDAVAALPGFDPNPYAAMRAADLFVLSSRWEGLPTVLIEALAAGTNVVSTDCPSGPYEVLARGEYGTLVPVADPGALAAAITHALDHQIDADRLRLRADFYSLENSVARYEQLFGTLLRPAAGAEKAPNIR